MNETFETTFVFSFVITIFSLWLTIDSKGFGTRFLWFLCFIIASGISSISFFLLHDAKENNIQKNTTKSSWQYNHIQKNGSLTPLLTPDGKVFTEQQEPFIIEP